MKSKTLGLLSILAFALCPPSGAQTYDTNGDYVQTFAGSGFRGYIDGVGQQTMFNNPNAIVADSHSNLFVWDSGNYVIRKIAPDSTVTTYAGGGKGTKSTGVGTNVNFSWDIETVAGMTIDHNDTIWMVAWTGSDNNCLLYRITGGAVVTNTNLAQIVKAGGICADSVGNIYISDDYGYKIYRYNTNGVLAVFAGSGNSGYVDGMGIFTAFDFVGALAADAANNIYVWDWGNCLIRKIDQNQNVTTFAGKYQRGYGCTDGFGTNAIFENIGAMCADGFGNLILTDFYYGSCSSVRKISVTTNVVTLAGSFTQVGYANGAGNVALFRGADNDSSGAPGICVSGGMIYIADTSNQRIRSITNNPQAQVVSGPNLAIGTFPGLTITGVVGRTYQIQTSPDMNTWSTVATFVLSSTPYLWIDQNPVSANKFYRALLLP